MLIGVSFVEGGYLGNNIDCVELVLDVHCNLDFSGKGVSLDCKESRNDEARANAEGGGIAFRAELRV